MNASLVIFIFALITSTTHAFLDATGNAQWQGLPDGVNNIWSAGQTVQFQFKWNGGDKKPSDYYVTIDASMRDEKTLQAQITGPDAAGWWTASATLPANMKTDKYWKVKLESSSWLTYKKDLAVSPYFAVYSQQDAQKSSETNAGPSGQAVATVPATAPQPNQLQQSQAATALVQQPQVASAVVQQPVVVQQPQISGAMYQNQQFVQTTGLVPTVNAQVQQPIRAPTQLVQQIQPAQQAGVRTQIVQQQLPGSQVVPAGVVAVGGGTVAAANIPQLQQQQPQLQQQGHALPTSPIAPPSSRHTVTVTVTIPYPTPCPTQSYSALTDGDQQQSSAAGLVNTNQTQFTDAGLPIVPIMPLAPLPAPAPLAEAETPVAANVQAESADEPQRPRSAHVQVVVAPATGSPMFVPVTVPNSQAQQLPLVASAQPNIAQLGVPAATIQQQPQPIQIVRVPVSAPAAVQIQGKSADATVQLPSSHLVVLPGQQSPQVQALPSQAGGVLQQAAALPQNPTVLTPSAIPGQVPTLTQMAPGTRIVVANQQVPAQPGFVQQQNPAGLVQILNQQQAPLVNTQAIPGSAIASVFPGALGGSMVANQAAAVNPLAGYRMISPGVYMAPNGAIVRATATNQQQIVQQPQPVQPVMPNQVPTQPQALPPVTVTVTLCTTPTPLPPAPAPPAPAPVAPVVVPAPVPPAPVAPIAPVTPDLTYGTPVAPSPPVQSQPQPPTPVQPIPAQQNPVRLCRPRPPADQLAPTAQQPASAPAAQPTTQQQPQQPAPAPAPTDAQPVAPQPAAPPVDVPPTPPSAPAPVDAQQPPAPAPANPQVPTDVPQQRSPGPNEGQAAPVAPQANAPPQLCRPRPSQNAQY